MGLNQVCFCLFTLLAFSSTDLPVSQPKMNVWVTLANVSGLDTMSVQHNPGKTIFHLFGWCASGCLANPKRS